MSSRTSETFKNRRSIGSALQSSAVSRTRFRRCAPLAARFLVDRLNSLLAVGRDLRRGRGANVSPPPGAPIDDRPRNGHAGASAPPSPSRGGPPLPHQSDGPYAFNPPILLRLDDTGPCLQLLGHDTRSTPSEPLLDAAAHQSAVESRPTVLHLWSEGAVEGAASPVLDLAVRLAPPSCLSYVSCTIAPHLERSGLPDPATWDGQPKVPLAAREDAALRGNQVSDDDPVGGLHPALPACLPLSSRGRRRHGDGVIGGKPPEVRDLRHVS